MSNTRKEKRQYARHIQDHRVIGTSPVSFAEAVEAAVAVASATVRHMD